MMSDFNRLGLTGVVFAFVLACDGSAGTGVAPPDATKVEPAPVQPPHEADDSPAQNIDPVEPETPPTTLADDLVTIDASVETALDQIADRFAIHYPPGASHDDARQHADLDRVIELLNTRSSLLDDRVAADPNLGAAACAVTGKCDSGAPTDDALAWIETQGQAGTTFVYSGEGTTMAAVAYGVLSERLAGSLSPGGVAYLSALRREQIVDAHRDEDGYGGPPSDAVAAILGWETLAGYEAYRAVAESQVTEALSTYFSMSLSEMSGRQRHPISKAARASYRDFSSAYPDSVHAAAVSRFYVAMKKVRFKPTASQLEAARAAALGTTR